MFVVLFEQCGARSWLIDDLTTGTSLTKTSIAVLRNFISLRSKNKRGVSGLMTIYISPLDVALHRQIFNE